MTKFLAIAPAGQDLFEQANTYLHLTATKVLAKITDMYEDPGRMIEDMSALGLRHVEYASSADLFNVFVPACVEDMQIYCRVICLGGGGSR